MPAVIRKQTKYSAVQSFRAWSERILIDAAQEELHRAYPGTSGAPRRASLPRSLVRSLFKTGFRLTPLRIRRRVMSVMLIRKGQDWDPA
jgi:hypothetical protein